MTNEFIRTMLVEKLDTLKYQLLAKFDAGRIEHAGEEITTMDFQKEMKMEIFDLLIYHLLSEIAGQYGVNTNDREKI